MTAKSPTLFQFNSRPLIDLVAPRVPPGSTRNAIAKRDLLRYYDLLAVTATGIVGENRIAFAMALATQGGPTTAPLWAQATRLSDSGKWLVSDIILQFLKSLSSLEELALRDYIECYSIAHPEMLPKLG